MKTSLSRVQQFAITWIIYHQTWGIMSTSDLKLWLSVHLSDFCYILESNCSIGVLTQMPKSQMFLSHFVLVVTAVLQSFNIKAETLAVYWLAFWIGDSCSTSAAKTAGSVLRALLMLTSSVVHMRTAASGGWWRLPSHHSGSFGNRLVNQPPSEGISVFCYSPPRWMTAPVIFCFSVQPLLPLPAVA